MNPETPNRFPGETPDGAARDGEASAGDAPADDPTDGTLARRAAGGDRSAFDVLVARHHGMVHAVAVSRLGGRAADRDRADDLAQEVFLRAWLHLGTVREPDHLPRWLARVTRNLAVTWRRDDRRRSDIVAAATADAPLVDQVPDPRPDARDILSRRRESDLLAAALPRLAADDRDIVCLHYMEGLPHAAIADRLGIHRTSATRRIDKALENLRRLAGVAVSPSAGFDTDNGFGALRPSAGSAAAVMAVVASAAALPPAARAALVATTRDTSSLATAALPATSAGAAPAAAAPALNIVPALWAKGILIVTSTQKLAAVAVVIAATGLFAFRDRLPFLGGAPSVASAIAATRPDRTVAYATGQEQMFDIPVGKTVRMDCAPLRIVDKKFEKYVANYKTVDLTAMADGTLRARVLFHDGRSEEVTVPGALPAPGEPGPMDGLQGWNDMHMGYTRTIAIRPAASGGGLTVVVQSKDKPELMKEIKAIEADTENGNLTRPAAAAKVAAAFEREDMLPKDPDARRASLAMIDKTYGRAK